MSSLLETIKKFLGNKNTVTILGVVAGVLVLVIGYNIRLKKAINPITIPYAKETINAKAMITEDKIGYIKVSKSIVNNSDNILTNAANIVNKYVAMGTTIPANSLFYDETVVDSKELPDSAFANIKDGETIYSLAVDQNTTYGNSIYPDNYIDLYFEATDENGQIIFGKLIESIKVLAVKDSQGNHLFESTVETRRPSELLFAVPDDMYLLLMKAGYISSRVEIIPVPRNSSYSQNPGDTVVASEYIKNFILSQTVIIPDEAVSQTTASLEE